MFSADGKTSLIIDTDRAYCPNTKNTSRRI